MRLLLLLLLRLLLDEWGGAAKDDNERVPIQDLFNPGSLHSWVLLWMAFVPRFEKREFPYGPFKKRELGPSFFFF